MSAAEKDAIETLHRLLHRALVDMRWQGHEHNNKTVFHLADLFHNIVLEMGRAAEGKSTFEHALALLVDRAKEKSCERWPEVNLPGPQAGGDVNGLTTAVTGEVRSSQ